MITINHQEKDEKVIGKAKNRKNTIEKIDTYSKQSTGMGLRKDTREKRRKTSNFEGPENRYAKIMEIVFKEDNRLKFIGRLLVRARTIKLKERPPEKGKDIYRVRAL